MKLHIFTIVLDGMPFLPMQLNILNQLTCDWKWTIVEGAAANVHCTSWCKKQEPRFSNDGSHEFIVSLTRHPRLRILSNIYWPGGKAQMCNAALGTVFEPCALLQMDVDELWTPERLDSLPNLLNNDKDKVLAARFVCRYLLGPNLVAQGLNCYGNNAGEWLRLWKFTPGMRFKTHEPPVLLGFNGAPVPEHRIKDRHETEAMGFRFDHWAYVFERQVAYKEMFYGYGGAVQQWRALQQYAGPFPAVLKHFLPWVDAQAKVGPLHAL
jgi:hypothetical protein